MSWFWAIIFLSFTVNINFSEAKHSRSAVVVVGTVYCDTCFRQDFPKHSHFITGASVEVECKDTNSRSNFRQEVKTNEHGEFRVHLPFSVSKHVRKIKGCAVKLLSSNQPYCAVAAAATSSSLHLKSRKEGTHIFSAGFFTFKPLKQPEICDQKPSISNEKLSPIANPNDPTFLPPIQDPPSEPPALVGGGGGGGGLLPPLPRLPVLPPLPQLPRLPQIPFLPPLPKKENAAKASQVLDKKVINQPMSFPFPFPPLIPPNPLLPPPSLLPPNPLLPPPSLLPPNPFQPPPSVIPPVLPTPPPSLFPPLFPTPSTPPSFLPPIPGFTPSPPPPALPSFPIPLPPFPFQPTPGFPGVPPAQASSQPKTGLP